MNDAKQQCEQLLGAVLPFAQSMLEKHGEFYPYAGVIRSTGEIGLLAGGSDAERPSSADLIGILTERFRQGAASGEFLATALARDVRITLPGSNQKSDAIAVALDHRNNFSVLVVIPYEIADGTLTMGESWAEAGPADMFSR